MPGIRICSTRSDPIREMHLQSFGNPSQCTDEKRAFRRSDPFGIPIPGDSSRIVGNLLLWDYFRVARDSGGTPKPEVGK